MNAFIPALRRHSLLRWPDLTMFDRLFDGFNVPDTFTDTNSWTPNIDVSETEKEIVLRAEVPGIDKKDIDVTLTEGLLTIKGEKKHTRDTFLCLF